MHTGNKYIDYNTIFNTLKELNPDVILWEYENDFKTVFGLRTARFLKIAKLGVGQLALQKYVKRFRHHNIFGFDTSFISRRQYIIEKTKMFTTFFNQLDTMKMSITDSIQYAAYIGKLNLYVDFTANQNLIGINQPNIIDTSRTLYLWDVEHILPLSKKYMWDSLLIDKFENELAFWKARNDFMVSRIKAYLA